MQSAATEKRFLKLFSLVLYFAGTVWVYGYFAPNISDVSLENYCNQTAYYLSFCLITLTYIAVAFAGLCFFCFIFFFAKQ